MVLLYRCEKKGFKFWSACPPVDEFDERLIKVKSFSDYPSVCGYFEGECFTSDDVEWIQNQIGEMCYEE